MSLLSIPMITPTTLVSSVNTDLVSLSPHRYEIEMAGLTWAFFTDGLATFYRTSEDGVEWSPPVNIALSIRGNDFSFFYDDLHLHITYYYYSTWVRKHYLYYRMGTPNPDGSITWVAPAQQVKYSTGAYRPVILSVDSNGYPWIAYGSYVTKSSRNDGGWATEFDTVPVTGVTGSLMSVVPLTGGKMYIMFIWGSTLYGVPWDGSAFGAPENLGICYTNYGYSVVPHGDIVHLVHTRGYSDLIHRIRGLDGKWSEPVVIYPIDIFNHSTITLDPKTGDLHCLWTNDPILDHIFYKRRDYSSGMWDAEPFDLIDDSELGNPIWLTSHAYVERGRLGVMYRAGIAAPYEVRSAVMSPSGPEPYTVIDDFTVPEYLPEGSDVNVRVLVRNIGDAAGYLFCVIDGNPNDPDDFITVETGTTSPTSVAPGGSMWIDIYFRYDKMPSWDFNLIARNYDQTSQISKTISHEAPAVRIPTTLTLSAPDKADVGEKFNISGILYETDAGIPIPNQPINHSYNGKNLGTSTTGVDGDYLKEVSVPKFGVWTIKSEFLGTETFQVSKSQADVIIATTPIEAATVIAIPAAIGLALTIYCLN